MENFSFPFLLCKVFDLTFSVGGNFGYFYLLDWWLAAWNLGLILDFRDVEPYRSVNSCSPGRMGQVILGLGNPLAQGPPPNNDACGSLSPYLWPRYHYYGIAVKENSQYYDVMYSKKGAAWVSETGKKEVSKQTVAYSPRSKLGTLLPEFPNVKELNLPASLPEEKVTASEGSGRFLSLFFTQHTHTHTHVDFNCKMVSLKI